jgi:hypothetical protein
VNVLPIIEEALVLLNKLVPDQATRISNKIKALREKWDEEYAKMDKRDDNMLALIDMELRDIRESQSHCSNPLRLVLGVFIN